LCPHATLAEIPLLDGVLPCVLASWPEHNANYEVERLQVIFLFGNFNNKMAWPFDDVTS